MMEEKAISVSQLSGYIKGIFEAEELLHNISVYGEISGLSVLRGNAYFSLKDEDALLSCVYFGCDESMLKNGDLVVVTGTPRYYVKGGKLNFNVVKVQPYGLGELFKKFLETKDRLEKEGLFDQNKKKALPEKVKRIGVVSSESGAVIQDIINVTTRRNKAIDIVLYPARVQGEGAEKDIIEGIKFFDKYDVDVIVVARGGGSFEDLMPFNSEELARVVFEANKPIVSAVGHETDFTIIDFVADLRAPTPSAAAELIAGDSRVKSAEIVGLFDRITTMLANIVGEKTHALTFARQSLENKVKSVVNDKEYALMLSVKALEKLDPSKILQRGYAKIERNGQKVNTIADISIKDALEIYMIGGKIDAEVVNITRE